MKPSWTQSWWFLTISIATLALLAVAFSIAPAALLREPFSAYSDPTLLGTAAGQGLVDFWQSNMASFPASLSHLVDYWFWWHAIKTVICVLFITAAVLLCIGIWRRYLTATRRGAATVWAIAAWVVSFVALGAAITLLANVQSTLVPFVSALQLIDSPDSVAGLSQTFEQIRAALVATPNVNQAPALKVLVGQVQLYE